MTIDVVSPPKPPSERHQICLEIASWLSEHHWCHVFGGDVALCGEGRHKYYGTLLSKARILDGEIRVYSPKYILVRLTGPMARGEWSGVLASKADVMKFFELFGSRGLETAETGVNLRR